MMDFHFGDTPVRIKVDESGIIWWVAKDVCEALGIRDASMALRRLHEDEKGTSSVGTLGGTQEMLTINEPGLYRLIFTSRKKEAERFQRWVFHEVLPQIRRTGSYQRRQPEQLELYSSNIPETSGQLEVRVVTTTAQSRAGRAAETIAAHAEAVRRQFIEAGASDEIITLWLAASCEAMAMQGFLTTEEKASLFAVIPRLRRAIGEVAIRRPDTPQPIDVHGPADDARRAFSAALRRAVLEREDINEIALNAELKELFGTPRRKWSMAQIYLAMHWLARQHSIHVGKPPRRAISQ